MKKTLTTLVLLAAMLAATAQTRTVTSPDGHLTMTVSLADGRATYSIAYDGHTMLEPSALGLETSMGDFTQGLRLDGFDEQPVSWRYTLRQGKKRDISFEARRLAVNVQNQKRQPMTIEFYVANNDVAFRYLLPQTGDTACVTIDRETTAFRLPAETTTFLTPQSDPMVGWMQSKPSYEEEYRPDRPLSERSQFGHGYTFPCLFRVGQKGWLLLSETGTDGRYPGCRLSDWSEREGYTVSFPMEGECRGWGSSTAAMVLPGATAFRTITVGSTLSPIVETTIATDVVEPKYEPSCDYKAGRYTWSWLVWQDESINWDDQVQFIDVASAMGFEYCLVDCAWDQNIGYERMEQLAAYARGKGVSLLLWYNSNGFGNDAPQTPKHKMSTSAARRKEMAWLKSIGAAGIKVDFFQGDKQHTMQLYEDILRDANDFGLQVIFHGCTLPRGWERMFPNFVAAEAVLASENVYFTDYHAQKEAFELTMHPFCRNAVASMDWGGTIMNQYLSKDNKSRHKRYTTDTFEMAAAITIQTSLQCIAMQPNNLTDLPQHERDLLSRVPTTWQQTRLLEGYPGRYVLLARQSSAGRWYVAGLNAEGEARELTVSLPELAGQTVNYYYDDARKGPQLRQLTVSKKGTARVTLQPNGGIILEQAQ